MLTLLLRALNSFLWDAAVSSREAAKGEAGRRDMSRLSGSTCDTTPAPGLNEGRLTRLNRELSFTLVFGTFSYVLERGINIVSTEVPLCPF